MKSTLPFALISLLILAACGPGGSTVAKFKIVNAGTGPDLVTSFNHIVGSRFTYGVMEMGKLTSTSDGYYSRKVTLTQGPEAVVYSTEQEDIFIQKSADGELVWGGSEDIANGPILQIKLPLKQDLEWETYDADGIPFYRFHVEATERVDVPAGTFMTARVLQSNLRASTSVTRWYAQDVGLVQRNNSVLLRYELNRESP